MCRNIGTNIYIVISYLLQLAMHLCCQHHLHNVHLLQYVGQHQCVSTGMAHLPVLHGGKVVEGGNMGAELDSSTAW